MLGCIAGFISAFFSCYEREVKYLHVNFMLIDHSENLKEILGASNSFELCIAQKLYSMYGEAAGSSWSNFLKPYMVRHEDVLCAHDT